MFAKRISASFAHTLLLATLGLSALGATTRASSAEETIAPGARAPMIDGSSCDTAAHLGPQTTWRDPGSPEGAACFTVEVAASGLLVVELIQPAAAPPAHLLWSDAGAPQAILLHHGATTLVAAVPAGSYRLRVATDDPAAVLDPFRLRIDRARPATKGEGDGELELEPDPLTASGGVGGVGGEGERDGELELEPDPLAGPPARIASDLSAVEGLRGRSLASLCRRAAAHKLADGEPADGVADTFLCAARLPWERTLEGELASGWGDDVDVYRFDLARTAPVEIQARAVTAYLRLEAALYDRHGLRLETLTGDETQVRVARTLVPGTYFVRVSGRDGGEGGYAVRVAVRDER